MFIIEGYYKLQILSFNITFSIYKYLTNVERYFTSLNKG